MMDRDDFVNRITQLSRQVSPAGIQIRTDLKNAEVSFQSPFVSVSFPLVHLYRPSSHDIERAGGKKVLLVLTTPDRYALKAAAEMNYLVLPSGPYRIVAEGILLVLEASTHLTKASRPVRLTGEAGLIVETLLLGGSRRSWSVQELARAAKASATLTHQVLSRLEEEGFLMTEGSGQEEVRSVRDFRSLAERWRQEERKPKTVWRGFLEGSSPEAIAHQVLKAHPYGAVGGLLAAHLYKPISTPLPPPLRLWVSCDFNPASLKIPDLKRMETGGNIEMVTCLDNSWRVHRNSEGIPKVSKARAWREVADLGRDAWELADALLHDLEQAR